MTEMPGRGPFDGPGREIVVTLAHAWAEHEGRARELARPRFHLDASGRIKEIECGEGRPRASAAPVYDLGAAYALPGFVNAHSHAFQRAIRGATHRQPPGESSFWSWREAMYGAAGALDPERVYATSRGAFAEMLRAGITCVGEFHYLHHQRDGRPYPEPNALSHAVLRAAAEVGLRITLLEVYYARAGAGSPPNARQARFCDASVDAYFERVGALHEGLAARHPDARLGLAPHSIRAVGGPDLARIAEFAAARDWPVHAHVSEQPRENQECAREHGTTPLGAFERAGCLARPGAFTAVHAIHLEADDFARLRGQQVCACPTTEADLGDGIVPARALLDAGVTLALGSDSNAVIDPIQEARCLEMHERLAHLGRTRLTDAEGRVAPTLLAAMSSGGARALARPELGRLAVGTPFDAAILDLDHPLLEPVAPEHRLDAILTTAHAGLVRETWVAGQVAGPAAGPAMS